MSENPPGAGSNPPGQEPGAPQYGAPQQPQYGAPQQPQYGAPQGFGGSGPVSDSDRRTWSMLSHLGGIVLGFIAPLVVWLLYKDRDEFLKDQSNEALNFQITVIIGYVAGVVLGVVTLGILSFLPLLVWIANVIFCIIGGMAANRGERYRYPFALRLVS